MFVIIGSELTYDSPWPIALIGIALQLGDTSAYAMKAENYKPHRSSVCRWCTLVVLLATLFSVADGRGAEPAEYPPAIASLSSNDNLDDFIRRGYDFDGIEIAMHRCTRPPDRLDPDYSERKKKLQHLKIRWGAFAFIGASKRYGSGTAQGRHLVETIWANRSSDAADKVLVSVNWLKYGKQKHRYAEPDTVVNMCKEVHRLIGRWPMLLVEIDLLQRLLERQEIKPDHAEVLRQCELWIGTLGTQTQSAPVLPHGSPWDHWVFWLHSSEDFPPEEPQPRKERGPVPDLSAFFQPRETIPDWYDAHAWNHELAIPLNQ